MGYGGVDSIRISSGQIGSTRIQNCETDGGGTGNDFICTKYIGCSQTIGIGMINDGIKSSEVGNGGIRSGIKGTGGIGAVRIAGEVIKSGEIGRLMVGIGRVSSIGNSLAG